MTQNDFEFLRDSLLGKCDRLLKEIVDNDNIIKTSKQRLKEIAEQQAKELEEQKEEKKGEENE